MKVAPLFALSGHLDYRVQWATNRWHRKSIICLLEAEDFPPGTPRIFDGKVKCYREEIKHFHMRGNGEYVENGIEHPGRFAIAPATKGRHIGPCRRAMRRFLAAHPPQDSCTMAFQLRRMVRPGD